MMCVYKEIEQHLVGRKYTSVVCAQLDGETSRGNKTRGEKKYENDFDAKQRTETTWMTMVRTQRDR